MVDIRPIISHCVAMDKSDDIDVRAIRRQLGWSQRRLALEMGLTQGTISHWERENGYEISGPARKLLKMLAVASTTDYFKS